MFTVPEPPTAVSSPTAQALWETAVCLATTKARAALPHSNGRIDKAQQMVLAGAVELLDAHQARVTRAHARPAATAAGRAIRPGLTLRSAQAFSGIDC